MSNSELVDIDATLVFETDKAYLINTGAKKNIWIPKSIAEKNDDGTFTIPKNFAYERGLI